MKNLPEKIYLNLGFVPDQSDDFNDLSQVTWSQDKATSVNIEYTRTDVAKNMAKEFANLFFRMRTDWLLGIGKEPNIYEEFEQFIKLKKWED